MDTALILGLGGLITTLAGSLGAPQLAARAQRSQRRADELRDVLDRAAEALAATEAAGRGAWRSLLELDFRSDRELDAVLRDPLADIGFPAEHSTAGAAAVLAFGAAVEKLQTMVIRLALRLGDESRAVRALSSAQDRFGSVATTMGFAANGGMGSSDLDQTVEVFFEALRARTEFVSAARDELA